MTDDRLDTEAISFHTVAGNLGTVKSEGAEYAVRTAATPDPFAQEKSGSSLIGAQPILVVDESKAGMAARTDYHCDGGGMEAM